MIYGKEFSVPAHGIGPLSRSERAASPLIKRVCARHEADIFRARWEISADLTALDSECQSRKTLILKEIDFGHAQRTKRKKFVMSFSSLGVTLRWLLNQGGYSP
jgi:hypothetical protein